MSENPSKSLVEALRDSVEASSHLKAADAVAVAALEFALQKLEEAAARTDADPIKIAYMVPQLRSLLDMLALTPKSRIEMALDAAEETGKLADLRARRAKKSA